MEIPIEKFSDFVKERLEEFRLEKQKKLESLISEELRRNGYEDFEIEDGVLKLGEKSILLEYGDLLNGIPPKAVIRTMVQKIKNSL